MRKPSNTPKNQLTSEALCADLIQKYRSLYDEDEHPSWAWNFPPSIPFIGTRYRPGRGFLIYASAENFAWMNRSDIPDRYVTEQAWNRYRAAFEDEGHDSSDFFPTVGIQPVTDGGLLTAGLFVAREFGLPTRNIPRVFLETLAVSNWCKFTIQHENNRDYISNVKKLTASLPFVVTELAALQPTVVLLPQGVWRQPVLAAAMRGATPKTHFLPVPQFNASVVNCHLKDLDQAAEALHRRNAETPLADWMQNLVGVNRINAWRYLASLQHLLSKGLSSI